MSIKKKLDKSLLSNIEEIIAKGGQIASDSAPIPPEKEWTNFCIRMPTVWLLKIENILEDRKGITRTGWILEAIQEKLKRME